MISSDQMSTTYHAEHVGSLLRPPELLEARAAHAQGRVTDERLGELEDRAVLDAIELQRQAGIHVFTDGEMRRGTWMAGLLESLGGVVPVPTAAGGVRWRRDDGQDPSAEETHFDMVVVSGELSQKRRLTAIEAAFLARHASAPYKITMMSASMGALLWRPGVSDAAYPTPADLVRDLVRLQIAEIEGLLDGGVGWIQLDSLSYNQVIDEAFREQLARGLDPNAILDQAVTIDQQLVRSARARKPDVTLGLHVCRGNNRSAWMARGSFEPVAERLFGEVDVDRLLLEYDTERAGGFEPLRFVAPGRTVVLGLISSKVPRLESQDDLLRRIDEAARYVAMDDLAISPQCGFASTARGNLLTVDEERRKLELVAETARRAWG
jgi:5-methyltetrahydropteroyltriglutamate--homocysteine methyltransferase